MPPVRMPGSIAIIELQPMWELMVNLVGYKTSNFFFNFPDLN